MFARLHSLVMVVVLEHLLWCSHFAHHGYASWPWCLHIFLRGACQGLHLFLCLTYTLQWCSQKLVLVWTAGLPRWNSRAYQVLVWYMLDTTDLNSWPCSYKAGFLSYGAILWILIIWFQGKGDKVMFEFLLSFHHQLVWILFLFFPTKPYAYHCDSLIVQSFIKTFKTFPIIFKALLIQNMSSISLTFKFPRTLLKSNGRKPYLLKGNCLSYFNRKKGKHNSDWRGSSAVQVQTSSMLPWVVSPVFIPGTSTWSLKHFQEQLLSIEPGIVPKHCLWPPSSDLAKIAEIND